MSGAPGSGPSALGGDRTGGRLGPRCAGMRGWDGTGLSGWYSRECPSCSLRDAGGAVPPVPLPVPVPAPAALGAGARSPWCPFPLVLVPVPLVRCPWWRSRCRLGLPSVPVPIPPA